VNETIRNGSKILANVSKSLMTTTSKSFLNFTNCFGGSRRGNIFSIFPNMFQCAMNQAQKSMIAYADTTRTHIQNVTQNFNQLLKYSPPNSTVHTIPQMAELGSRLASSLPVQLAALGAQAASCMG
jgi:hypothetical protein